MVRATKIRKILYEISYILKKNPNLLKDGEVKNWLIMVYSIGLVYGDSSIRKFFKEIGGKLLQ